MDQYRIICLKEKMSEMVNTYPELIPLLYSQQNDVFETNQIELLFSPMSLGKEKLLQIIQKREDYTYYHGIHQLLNPITEEKISIVMNEYDIEVTESDEKHVVFDMIKAFSKKLLYDKDIIDFTNQNVLCYNE